MEFTSSGWAAPDVPPDAQQQMHDVGADVPTSSDVLPDGRPTIVIGDVSGYADLNHQQGDNPYGFQGDCGLCSCADVLDQFGGHVNEADVVKHAVDHQECSVTGDPSTSGGTSVSDQVHVLNDYGVPAHAEQHQSLEDLGNQVEQGHGVIVEVNAGSLWNDASAYENGQANHAVTVTGVARDPATGQIQGFYINDSGDGQSAQFVSVDTMTHAWVDTGGQAVVTDVVHTSAAAGH
jgi:uncharacterized protein YvpB